MSILTDFNPPFLPFSLVRECFIDTGCADFAEIGDGCSLRNALKQQFKEYHGIETCKRHYDAAVQRAAVECKMPTTGGRDSTWFDWQGKALTFYRGSSPEVLRLPKRGTWGAELPAVLDQEKRTTIWCDAHFQGTHADEMDPKYGQCPLTDELEVILAVPWKVPPIILIDDIHQMASAEWWREYDRNYSGPISSALDRSQWPKFQSIYDLLQGWTILLRDGIAYCWRE